MDDERQNIRAEAPLPETAVREGAVPGTHPPEGHGGPGPGEDRTPLDRVKEIADRVARSRGLEIFDVQMRRESVGTVLRVVIDRPAPTGEVPPGVEESAGVREPAAEGSAERGEQPIGVVDCQRVSEEIGAILDVEDFIDRAYTLEVSSPGLDRPLRHAADYRRFAGRLAKLVLTSAVDGQKHFKGRLRGIDGDQVLVEDDRGGMHRVPLVAIGRARLEVEF